MSESYERPAVDPVGGPISRPNVEGLPPGSGGETRVPGGDDSVDPGMTGGGDIGEDVGGGMAGEG